MSLFERKKGKVSYRYFNKGTSGQVYFGPVGKEDPEKVRGALDYVNKARDEYLDRVRKLESQLLELLPEEERRRIPYSKDATESPLILSLRHPPTEKLTEKELEVLASVLPIEKLEKIARRLKLRKRATERKSVSNS